MRYGSLEDTLKEAEQGAWRETRHHGQLQVQEKTGDAVGVPLTDSVVFHLKKLVMVGTTVIGEMFAKIPMGEKLLIFRYLSPQICCSAFFCHRPS